MDTPEVIPSRKAQIMEPAGRDLEKQFTVAMFGILERAKRLKPPLTFPAFLTMLNAHEGKGTADILLATKEPSDGFTKLFLHGVENGFGTQSLQLAMEYLVLQNPWHKLFSADQLAIARDRLIKVGCELPPEAPQLRSKRR
jgi:hypothetical protein